MTSPYHLKGDDRSTLCSHRVFALPVDHPSLPPLKKSRKSLIAGLRQRNCAHMCTFFTCNFMGCMVFSHVSPTVQLTT